ncbi:hypothetical protein SUGI_0221230 [Cryptomeria japonica]|nr:hypothetical protein SUGI_0221230 [Cryptomeria japonica]
MGLPKFSTIQLCRALFRKDILGDLNLAVGNVDEDMMVPYPEDYLARTDPRDMGKNRELVPKRPILIVKDKPTFEARKPCIARNIDFLQMWLGHKPTPGGDWWKDHMIVEGYEP